MAYPQPTQLKVRRFIIKRLLRGLFRLLFKLEITGTENIPPEGAYLMAHNHVSIIEPALIGAFWPENLEVIGAAELRDRRVQSEIVRFYGIMFVQRGAPERELLRKMLEVLQAGSPLMIAPEGTRSHVPGMGPAQPGIGYMIDQADVPVLPIGIIGSTDESIRQAFKFKRPQIEMRIGAPFRLPPIEGSGHVRRAARKENADQVMLKICELLPEAYWGVYADRYRNTRKTDRGDSAAGADAAA